MRIPSFFMMELSLRRRNEALTKLEVFDSAIDLAGSSCNRLGRHNLPSRARRLNESCFSETGDGSLCSRMMETRGNLLGLVILCFPTRCGLLKKLILALVMNCSLLDQTATGYLGWREIGFLPKRCIHLGL